MAATLTFPKLFEQFFTICHILDRFPSVAFGSEPRPLHMKPYLSIQFFRIDDGFDGELLGFAMAACLPRHWAGSEVYG
jgi:hypothetical protein